MEGGVGAGRGFNPGTSNGSPVDSWEYLKRTGALLGLLISLGAILSALYWHVLRPVHAALDAAMAAGAPGKVVWLFWAFVGGALLLVFALGASCLYLSRRKARRPGLTCHREAQVPLDGLALRLPLILRRLFGHHQVCANPHCTQVVVAPSCLVATDQFAESWRLIERELKRLKREMGREVRPIPRNRENKVRATLRLCAVRVIESFPLYSVPERAQACMEYDAKAEALMQLETFMDRFTSEVFDPLNGSAEDLADIVQKAKEATERLLHEAHTNTQNATQCTKDLKDHFDTCIALTLSNGAE